MPNVPIDLFVARDSLPDGSTASALSPRVAWWFFAGCGLVAAAAAVVRPYSAALSLLVMIAVLAASIVGFRRNQPSPSRPWWLLFVAGTCWLIAVTGWAFVDSGSPNRSYLPEIASIVGYLFAIAALWGMLRSRNSRVSGAWTDSILVASGAAVVGWTLVIVPTISTSRPTPVEMLVVLFPVLDAILLYLAIRLTLSQENGAPSARLLIGMFACFFFNNFSWALSVAGIGLAEYTKGPADLASLMAFVCAGTAALHPSMRLLVLPQTSNAERPLGPLRVLGMSLALALPVAAALWNQSDRVGDVVVVAVFASATIGLVLFRTYRAVNNAVRSEEFIRMQSIHDPLTGLKNRSWLIQNLSETMSADPEAETGLLLIDLDHFKYVNDTYGYAIGDQVLVAVARRLQEFAPESARLVHLGTDEFAITFVVDEPSEPDRLAAGILRALAEPFALDSLEIFIGASIGISSGAQLRATALDLLREADTAMYRAKAAGRNCGVWFDQSMSVHASQRLELETALRRALERNEFEVYYQPIVNLRDSSWRGVEALVRWNRPGTGLVSPAEFIPVAEETGLIVELGTWVLREAIRQVAEWRNEFGVQWAVSINVSPRQLKDPHAVEAIIGELRRGEIPWGSLWLELTEGLLIENDQHAKAQLEHLRHAGACIVVDDFGTGYSSLSYLQRFPIDRVKIDKSFTMSLGEDAESAAIVRAVLGMANALGLDAVAEGVETDEQRRRLIELGCGVGQGFLFSRPLPAAELVGQLPEDVLQ